MHDFGFNPVNFPRNLIDASSVKTCGYCLTASGHYALAIGTAPGCSVRTRACAIFRQGKLGLSFHSSVHECPFCNRRKTAFAYGFPVICGVILKKPDACNPLRNGMRRFNSDNHFSMPNTACINSKLSKGFHFLLQHLWPPTAEEVQVDTVRHVPLA